MGQANRFRRQQRRMRFRAGNREPRERPNTLYSMRIIHDAIVALTDIPVPVVAKVRGVAVGAGMSLALACDMVVASDNARFAAIFARRGLSLDCGASWLLPRLVGIQKAKEGRLYKYKLILSPSNP